MQEGDSYRKLGFRVSSTTKKKAAEPSHPQTPFFQTLKMTYFLKNCIIPQYYNFTCTTTFGFRKENMRYVLLLIKLQQICQLIEVIVYILVINSHDVDIPDMNVLFTTFNFILLLFL